MSVELGIVGAGGRLGRRIREAAEKAGWEVVLAADSSLWEIERTPEVVVDVSHRSALPAVANYCRRAQLPLVHGVSGLRATDRLLLDELSEYVPVVRAPNFAFGHLLQTVMLEAGASIRGGIPVSEHELLLAGEGETVTLSHRVADLSAAAAGALRAAAWAVGRPAGLWGMRDVFASATEPVLKGVTA